MTDNIQPIHRTVLVLMGEISRLQQLLIAQGVDPFQPEDREAMEILQRILARMLANEAGPDGTDRTSD